MANITKKYFNSKNFVVSCMAYQRLGQCSDQTKFLTRCRKHVTGDLKPKWEDNELEFKLHTLEKYFPGFNADLQKYLDRTEESRKLKEERDMQRSKELKRNKGQS